jgi:AraC-like DNA-binding protein
MSSSRIHFRFEARQYQRLHRVSFMAPTLIWVRHGTKQIQTHGSPWRCIADECLCLPAGEIFEMENLPASKGHYQADIFTAPRGWTEQFLQQYAQALPTRWHAAPHFPCDAELAQTLSTLMGHAAGDTPLSQAQSQHAWHGVLLRLAGKGLAAPLFHLQPLDLTQRIQTLLHLDLARPWRVMDVAQRLGSSESTLRRHLRQNKTSFSAILSDLRLHEAFSRVMTTSQPLMQVALDCGFQSPSRFSHNFRQRYGMSPSALRQGRGLDMGFDVRNGDENSPQPQAHAMVDG